MINFYKQYSSTIIGTVAFLLLLIHPLLLFVVGCTTFVIILYKNRYNLLPEELEKKTYVTKEKVHYDDLPEVDIVQRGDMYMSEEDKAWYLLSPEWENLRCKVFQRDGHKCVICKSPNNLNCHHITYTRLGDEDLKDLATLCGGSDGCHTKLHLKLGYDREGYYPPLTN